MATQTVKMTVSLPKRLVSVADEIASEEKTTRSRVVSNCLSELAEKRTIELMEEGYKVMAQEHVQFAQMSADAASEIVPPWG